MGLCLGPYGGPDGEAVTHVRGTPVHVTVVGTFLNFQRSKGTAVDSFFNSERQRERSVRFLLIGISV